MSARKLYWQAVYIGNAGAKEAVISWFEGMADGMTVYKAEILCDRQTDIEKKIRAFMTDEDGDHYQFVRTCGGRTFGITMKRIAAPTNEMGAKRSVARPQPISPRSR